MFKGITGNVLVLGLVSLLTDVSSEMIYPLLPLFLTTVLGAGPVFLGVIEGVAESISSFLKLYSGIISDRIKGRKKLVLTGYAISSISRPFIAIAGAPFTVLMVRFIDRLGKGIRTSPRDALIADSIDPLLRGKAFGFTAPWIMQAPSWGRLLPRCFSPGSLLTCGWSSGSPPFREGWPFSWSS
ncbi:MAG: MFS transporter [Geobacteraceae bacterium]